MTNQPKINSKIQSLKQLNNNAKEHKKGTVANIAITLRKGKEMDSQRNLNLLRIYIILKTKTNGLKQSMKNYKI